MVEGLFRWTLLLYMRTKALEHITRETRTENRTYFL